MRPPQAEGLYAIGMTVVRSSVFSDFYGALRPRRLLVEAINKIARGVVEDLAETVLPFCRAHTHVLGPSVGEAACEKFIVYEKVTFAELIDAWAMRHHLTERNGGPHLAPPEWLLVSIWFTLKVWLAGTDARSLLLSDARSPDSPFPDLAIEVQYKVLQAMSPYFMQHECGEMSTSALIRIWGDMHSEMLGEEMRSMEDLYDDNVDPPSPLIKLRPRKIRLSFEPADAEAAVRYQVLGQHYGNIARDESEASNLGKNVRAFLKAVDIQPRRR
jgi:hypothetical protein